MLSVQQDNTCSASGDHGTYDGMTVELLAGSSANSLHSSMPDPHQFVFNMYIPGGSTTLNLAEMDLAEVGPQGGLPQCCQDDGRRGCVQ